MAGSPGSPLARDKWRTAEGRGAERPRNSYFSGRERGWDRESGRPRPFDKEPRHSKPSTRQDFRFRSPQTSPPPAHRASDERRSSVASQEYGAPSAGRYSSDYRRPSVSSLRTDPNDRDVLSSPPAEPGFRRSPRREEEPLHPPKRRRTRSPSSRPFHRDYPPDHRDYSHHRSSLSSRGGDRESSASRRRGDRSFTDSSVDKSFKASDDVPFYHHPRSRDSPSPSDFSRGHFRRFRRSPSRELDSEPRGPSRQSLRSRSPPPHRESGSTMESAKPISSMASTTLQTSSPPRPISSFEAESDSWVGDHRPSEPYPSRDMRKGDESSLQRNIPRSGTHSQPYSASQFGSPANPHHGSSRPGSPYSNTRGGRIPQRGGRSPPYRHAGPPFSGPHHGSQSYAGPPRGGGYRGGRGGFGGPPRGRGHFSNLQWTAPGARNRGLSQSSTGPPKSTQSRPSTPDDQPHQSSGKRTPGIDGDDQPPTRPAADQSPERQPSRSIPDNDRDQEMPPPPATRPPAPEATTAATATTTMASTPTSSAPVKEGGKFSFAFKSKPAPPPVPKPVPDLAQRMQAREPPPKAVVEPPPRRPPPGPAGPPGPPPRFKPEFRPGRRDLDRDRRDRRRDDRRDFRDRDSRDGHRDERRFDGRPDELRRDSRHRPDSRFDRPRERSPENRSLEDRKPRIAQRIKPRPVLPEEYRTSDSVYYRKPGNESVIGAGTYGKVFKAVHVYTQRKVALKRIRMEGEKDGFPVTAVREIKLLQHLRNRHVVSLLEVMVEKNECFMVFEYLSHDLTGLINHPSFTLTAAHKKDLARQMFEGLQYLHHRGVLHRDIKAANILISNQGLLKFADFGLARFFSKSRQLDYTNRVITIWYRPPELLLGDTQYGPAVDVWSAACVFMEMFTKKAVFPGDGGEISQVEKLYNVLGTPTRADWPNIVDMPWFDFLGPTERRKRIFEDTYRAVLSPAALDLVAQMFRYDPAKRPSAEEVLSHAYFTTEEPAPQQPIELENIEGDWHEFESKALRKERERERREREKEKRKASMAGGPDPQDTGERESKRMRPEREHGTSGLGA